MKPRAAFLTLGLLALAAALFSSQPEAKARLNGSARGAAGGWITIQLAGAPAEIGYQHGYLLAREIDDALRVVRLNLKQGTKRDWRFFRQASERVLWPQIEAEYRAEMQGIADGARAAGVKVDLWDIVALNANIEFSYYTAELDKQKRSNAPDRCSAFAATGSWTRGNGIVIGHNNWSGYLEGERWNVIFDIRPAQGQRILMDGFPGMIHSGDDFGVNGAGIVITETTITGFHGFDPRGVPEFVRARKAMQYATSIGEFDRLMRAGNNGGYANTWLVADNKTGEIGRLELGLKHVTLERTKDGYFTGANFPIDPKLTAEETDFDVKNAGLSPNARRVRWEQLMAEYKGRIDLEAGKRFLADHVDVFDKANLPTERTLCGHNETSPRGMRPWQEPFAPAGAVQGKITDAALARAMALEAALGHPCGQDFQAAPHLRAHPEFHWMKPLLRDMPARPWTRFAAR